MAIELITCSSCGTKNASHRKVCLRCGAGILTPTGAKAIKGPSFSERLSQRLSSIGKQNESPETGEVSKYGVAAAAIVSAGWELSNFVKEHYLRDREIKPDSERGVLFHAEVTCYVLHMLDRTLSVPAFASSRSKIMYLLVRLLSETLCLVLKGMGYPQFSEEELAKGIDGKTFLDRMDEQNKQLALRGGLQVPGFAALVVNGFTEMYNERQLEYGALKKESWLLDVAFRFGQHAEEALDAHNEAIAIRCVLLAPEIFKELLPYLPIEVDI